MREKEYSEWMGKQGFDVLRHANCCKIAFNGGWESRQTEVDKLQVKLNGAEERALICLQCKDEHRAERDELQKRVDAALKILSSKKKMYVDMFIEIEQVLKGGEA